MSVLVSHVNAAGTNVCVCVCVFSVSSVAGQLPWHSERSQPEEWESYTIWNDTFLFPRLRLMDTYAGLVGHTT